MQSSHSKKISFPKIRVINGLKFAVCSSKIKGNNELDLLVVKLDPKSAICGTTTLSQTSSEAVNWCKKNIKKKQNNKFPIIYIINSGNANVFTGEKGKITVKKVIDSVTNKFNTVKSNVFVASTGVIGEVLDYKKITNQLDNLKKNLKPEIYLQAAKSIMTTDTFPKGCTKKIIIDEKEFVINGIAKGSGMIAPNMATMLAFIFTDVPITKSCLQNIVNKMTKKTFNSITVDGDTSTSDTLLVSSISSNKISEIQSLEDKRVPSLENALFEVMDILCKLIIKDGEGASKFIEIYVSGTKSDNEAYIVGKSIADSPLVKTAFFGEDPNWGRIIMAIGKSKTNIKKEEISILFGNNMVAENGSISNKYDEIKLKDYMKNDEIKLFVKLGKGKGKSKIYTCDFSKKYISINADYRS